jgi:diguanylate cyclase (GGDEF)-like protein
VGIDPTLFERPAAARISVAFVVISTVAVVCITNVHSYWSTAAALVAAAITWRLGPLFGGVVTGVFSAAIVMADPLLPHPMSNYLLGSVIVMMLVAMATGMVARRDSMRGAEGGAGGTGEFASIPARARETPVRSSRAVTTGELPRLKNPSGEMPARVKTSGELVARRPTVEAPPPRLSLTMVPAEMRTPEETQDLLEGDVITRFLRDVRDAVGADEVALWKHTEESDEVECYAAAVEDPKTLSLVTKPPLDSLVLNAALGGTATNYDNEPNYFLAMPAGAEGRFHGALGLYSNNRANFSRDRAKSMLPQFVNSLAELLHLLYDGRETRRYRGKAGRVLEAVERVQKPQEMGLLAEEICRAAIDVSGATRASFVLWDAAKLEGVVRGTVPPGATSTVATKESLTGMACMHSKGIMLREVFSVGGVPLLAAGESGPTPGSAAVVTVAKDRDVVGAIAVEGKLAGDITHVEVSMLQLLAKFGYVAVQSVRELELRTGQATRDALTGLANRHVFNEWMSKLQADPDGFGKKTSLILMDVDFFKKVNDTYGHDGGDAVLKGLAAALKIQVRPGDLFARIGGEELAIVLTGAPGQKAVEIAERLRQKVAATTVESGGKAINVTASFGVSSHPDSVFGVEHLFKAADEALYRAKREGRNRVEFAEPKGKKT